MSQQIEDPQLRAKLKLLERKLEKAEMLREALEFLSEEALATARRLESSPTAHSCEIEYRLGISHAYNAASSILEFLIKD